jgi:hypothetical protein
LVDDTFEFPTPPTSESEDKDNVMIPVEGGTTPTKEEIDEWTNDVLNEEDKNTIEQQAEEQFNDIADIEANNNNEDDNHNDNHNDNDNNNNNNNNNSPITATLFDGSHGGSNAAAAAAADVAAADNGPSPSHVPSHFEPPNREPLPAVPVQQGGNLSTSKSKTSTSIGGIIGILIVTTLIVITAILLLIRRRNKYTNKKSIKKQQLMFQKTFKNAECSIVNQSRNLNYRDHNNQPSAEPPKSSSNQYFQDALDEIKFTGSSGSSGSGCSSGVERFHDEEGGGRSRGGTSTARTSPRSLIGSFSDGVSRSSSSSDDNDNNNGQDQPDEVDFVLDSHILQRMN